MFDNIRNLSLVFQQIHENSRIPKEYRKLERKVTRQGLQTPEWTDQKKNYSCY